MLIICCGMSRSGSTVQYQACCEVMERFGLGQRSFTDEYDWLPDEPLNHPRPLEVIKAHEPVPEIEKRCAPGMIRWVYTHRDVRDVIVSLQQKIKIKLVNDELRFVLNTRLLNPSRHWQSKPACLVSRYDDLRDDLRTEVGRIARHLLEPVDLEAPAEFLDELARSLSLENARAVTATVDTAAGAKWDLRTKLHHNHVADAKSGKWRDHLTPEQLDVIHEVAGEWLAEHGYPV
jgi:hypothetical protein